MLHKIYFIIVVIDIN